VDVGVRDQGDGAGVDQGEVVGVAEPVAHEHVRTAPVESVGVDSSAHRFGYHAALDGIRALAVLAIIGFHDQYQWARGAYLAVDAFFLLSGYLITTLLLLEYRRHGTIKLKAFWGRRVRRLLPALLLVLLFVAWYTHAYVVPWERSSVRNDGIASLFYVANWRFIADKQSYFALFSAASPLRHMWTLAIEEQFYLVWPLLVIGCLKLGRGSMRILVAVSVVVSAVSVLLMTGLFQAGDPSRSYYGTDTHAHTLLIGALLAMVMVARPPGVVVRRLIAVVGTAALVVVLLLWMHMSDTDARYYHGGSLIYALLFTLVIAAAMNAGPVRGVLGFKPLAWIGTLSYGLYLWHWPITVWLVPTRVHVGTTELNLIRLAVTFAFAIASFYLVERPIREGRLFRARPAVWAVPAGVLLVLFGLLASTTGAAAAPSYIWGYGDPLICGTPRPSETQQAKAANRAEGKLSLPHSASHMRILLVGDSTACSLWTGLSAVGKANHIPIDQGSVFGCGVASDQITTTRGEQITPHSERCHNLVDTTLKKALARSRPNVILWMSIWEKSDLVINGKTLVNGTKAGDNAMLARMDDAFNRLTAGGAHIVILTNAAPAPNDAQGTQNTSNAVDNASYVRLNKIEHAFARRHRHKVTIIDLGKQICPKGAPCPEFVHGVRIRPDGRHFTPAAAAQYSRWVLQKLAKENT
jgi:peptidoglycan/LPS O-acetylase OafA/YrhL